MSERAQRRKMAERLPHAPSECFQCGGPNYVLKFSGGGGVARGYSESGWVECMECKHRERWAYDHGGLAGR